MRALIALPLDGGGELPQFEETQASTLRRKVVRFLMRFLGRKRRRVRRTMYLLG
jgi:hypothetical protein